MQKQKEMLRKNGTLYLLYDFMKDFVKRILSLSGSDYEAY